MRPLARLHAVTDADVVALDDLGVRAAALAAAGSAIALHARDRSAAGGALAALAERFVALARPAEAQVLVSGRPDIARAIGAQGVQLAATDLAPRDARQVLGTGHVGRSVHSVDEVRAARDEGADFVLLGAIFETASHPGRSPLGLRAVEAAARIDIPVIAIGGIDADRSRELREAGAYGVAAIRALWHAPDPAAAALAMLAPWTDDDN